MAKLLPRWLHPRALLIGLVVGAYTGYDNAARYGFSDEAIVGGVVSWFVAAVFLGAILTRILPKYFPSRPKE